ncbi:MAG: hypothetical protein LQ351_004392 [Letrouitia transgressa]|nr:MAG: hypothetical protein LQ351_004392 [Letrouitia transgressa]
MENTRPSLDEGHHTPSGILRSASSTISQAKTIVAPVETQRPSQQIRRLQLRNAGFKAATLPTRRISPFASELLARPVNDENSPKNWEKRSLYGEDLPPSPVNILQELHNCTRRKRTSSSKAGFGAIFHDHTATESFGEGTETSWFNDTGNGPSPVPRENLSMMKLREASINSKTPPPLSSPVAKQVKGRNVKRMNLRTTSFEAAKYIEHLESQLTALNTKLDSMMSPTAHKARAAKLRALTTESRSLKQDLAGWEEKFERRVQDEKERLFEVETSLTSRVRYLEDEVERKNNRARDLEWEIENLRARVKEAEGLEIINANLEKRIDVLTELLVQSPTKLELSSATTSPIRPDPHKRKPKPRSMLPKVPSSPSGTRCSFASNSEGTFWRGRKSFESASSISESPEGLQGAQRDDRTPQPTEPTENPNGCSSSDLSAEVSSSLQSATSSSSRPTSLFSGNSFGAHSWGLPLPPDPTVNVRMANRQRTMRRFPSGSCSLKPLILPTATGSPSLPTSAPICTSTPDSSQRYFSDISIDPTTTFLSQHDISSTLETPTQPQRRRSTSYAHTKALRVLEGRKNSFGENCEPEIVLSPKSTPGMSLETLDEGISDDERLVRQGHRSLNDELEFAEALSNSPDHRSDGLIPIDPEDTDKPGKILTEIEPQDFRTLCQSEEHPKISLSDQKPRAKWQPANAINPTLKSGICTAMSTKHAHGIFSRLTKLIWKTKQDPVLLAARLLKNAWSIGLARFGGIAWWLLGLVYVLRWRTTQWAANREMTVEDMCRSDIDECSHLSLGARRTNGKSPGPGFKRPLGYPHASSACLAACACDTRCVAPRGRNWAAKTNSEREPHIFPCPDCVEPSSRRTLRLWFRFSLAIVLAVGIAIKNGPEYLMEDNHRHRLSQDDKQQEFEGSLRSLSAEHTRASCGTFQPNCTGGFSPDKYASGSEGSIRFAKVLGPADFENHIVSDANE